jgi:hydroxyacylglutathione hydrolase-like protein
MRLRSRARRRTGSGFALRLRSSLRCSPLRSSTAATSTLANIRFARAADPKDTALFAGQKEATRLRDNQRSTLSPTIARER